MNLSRIKREHLLLLALAAAPAFVAQGLRFAELTSPRAASAAVDAPAVAAPEQSTFAPTPAQAKAAAWVASQPSSTLRDPFVAPAPPDQASEPSSTQIVTTPDRTNTAAGRVPQFRLTGVIERGQKPLAAINGKVFRVGEEVEPGWTLISVHGGERSVEIRHTDGRVVSVRVQPVETPR